MSFRWEIAEGDPTDAELQDIGFGEPFDTQEAAESWLTASFEDLADAGVTEVSLREDGRLVYGPMSLLP